MVSYPWRLGVIIGLIYFMKFFMDGVTSTIVSSMHHILLAGTVI